MNELFNVTTNGDKLTLSARELHKELNIVGRFSRWFEQMSEYGFEENVDFTSVQNCTVVNNGAMRELQDYQITLDMAKEIARDILQDAIGEAYYKLDTDKYSDDDQDLIIEYLEKEAERLMKLINREYITY